MNGPNPKRENQLEAREEEEEWWGWEQSVTTYADNDTTMKHSVLYPNLKDNFFS